MPKGKITKKKEPESKKQLDKEIKKVVKKELMVYPEKKFVDVAVNGLFMCQDTNGASAAYFCLTDVISQGTDDHGNRVGDSITLMSWEARFLFQINAMATAGNGDTPFCRFIVFQWHETINTGGSIGSALLAILPTSFILLNGAGGAIGITSMYNQDKKRAESYTILYDKSFYMLKSVTTSAYQNQQHILDIKPHKIKNKISYSSGSATTAKNHIFVLALSNINYSTTTNPQIYGSTLVRYTDV